jgi:hypothetical protein
LDKGKLRKHLKKTKGLSDLLYICVIKTFPKYAFFCKNLRIVCVVARLACALSGRSPMCDVQGFGTIERKNRSLYQGHQQWHFVHGGISLSFDWPDWLHLVQKLQKVSKK